MRQKKMLPCTLTADELNGKADEMVERMYNAERLRGDAKATAERFKKEIGGEEDRIEKLMAIIHSHEESREVECAIIPLENAFAMVTVRLDTGQEVTRRPMTEAERNGDLFSKEAEEEIPEDERKQNVRLQRLLELVENLRGAQVAIRLEDLAFTIEDEHIDEIRKWLAENHQKPIDDRDPAPQLLTEVLMAADKREREAEERQKLIERTVDLLEDVEIEVEPAVVAAWPNDDLNATSDYCQALIDKKENEQIVVPERPACLPLVVESQPPEAS